MALAPFVTVPGEDADPLEQTGGVSAAWSAHTSHTAASLGAESAPSWWSELVDNGTTHWMPTIPSGPAGAFTGINISAFRQEFLMSALGQAVGSWQGWAVAEFDVPASAGNALLLHGCSGALDYWIDAVDSAAFSGRGAGWPPRRFRADPFGLEWWFGPNPWFRSASVLAAGTHTIAVRAVSEFNCSVAVASSEAGWTGSAIVPLLPSNPSSRNVNPGVSTRVPDIVDGVLAGSWLSLPILNAALTAPETDRSGSAKGLPGDWATASPLEGSPTAGVGALAAGLSMTSLGVTSVRTKLVNATSNATSPGPAINLTMGLGAGTVVMPGQVQYVPLRAEMAKLNPCVCGSAATTGACTPMYDALVMEFNLTAMLSTGNAVSVPVNFTLACVTIRNNTGVGSSNKQRLGSSSLGSRSASVPATSLRAFTFTFQDFDGSVQYAAAKLPMEGLQGCRASARGCPVLLATHGATVDGAYGGWTGAIPAQPGVVTLFPTGRGAFGPDWQGYGHTSMMTALDALGGIVDAVWPAEAGDGQAGESSAVDTHRILWAGHSMGGHGCLLNSGRMPDRALGAACAAAWIKLQTYVPHTAGYGASSLSGRAAAILHAASEGAHADLYASAGHLASTSVPFHARMGSIDDAVSPFNLRRMARLHAQAGWPALSSGAASQFEVSVMEVKGEGHWFGDVMGFGAFLQDVVSNATAEGGWPGMADGQSSSQFHVASPRPSSLESKRGVRVLQVTLPGRPAELDVSVSGSGSATSFAITTANVRRFVIGTEAWCGLASSPLQCARRLPLAGVVVDGVELGLAQFGSQHYCRTDGSAGSAMPGVPVLPVMTLRAAAGAWAICSNADIALHAAENERVPGFEGPAKQALDLAPVVVVYPTVGDPAHSEGAAALWLANDLVFQGRFRVHLTTDAAWSAGGRASVGGAGLGLAGLGAPTIVLVGTAAGTAPGSLFERLLQGSEAGEPAASTLAGNVWVNSSTAGVRIAAATAGSSGSSAEYAEASLGVVAYGVYNASAVWVDKELAGAWGRVLLVAGTASNGSTNTGVGLRTALRFWPYVQTIQMEAANVGVPDVVIARSCAAFKGGGGIAAAGWNDVLWRGLSPWDSFFSAPANGC